MVLLFCILFFPAGNVKADDTLLPTAWDNRGVYPKRYSDLVSLDDGYMRVFNKEKTVCIEYYDNDFNIKSKKKVFLWNWISGVAFIMAPTAIIW